MTELWEPPRTSRLWKRGDPSGIPRNGLVGLWDPYRDVYGRNVLTDSGGFFSWASSTVTMTTGQPDPVGGTGAIRVQGTGGSEAIKASKSGGVGVAGVTYQLGIWVRNRSADQTLRVADGAGTIKATIAAGDAAWTFVSYTQVGNGSLGVRFSLVAPSAAGTVDADTYHPQLNLGPQLFPYSAPSGAPSTLQTSLDYSGNGNHLTLGATTNASTDDPAFTGTAWSFDGGDYMFKETPAGLSGCTGMTMIHVVSFPELVGWAVPLAMGRGGAPEPMYTMFGAAGEMYSQAKASGGNVGEYWGFTPSIDTTYMLTTIYSPSDGLLNFVGVTPKTGASANGSLSWSGFTAKLVVGMSSAISNGSKQSTNLVAVYNRPITLMELDRTYYNLKGLMAMRGVTVA
ncbi:MAG: hypothetical protein GYA36_21620 [Veillonellaceae bacterium]|nr:hypothetical protein [Veillonellaceae bacterium]